MEQTPYAKSVNAAAVKSSADRLYTGIDDLGVFVAPVSRPIG
jgi:hypothetical protein